LLEGGVLRIRYLRRHIRYLRRKRERERERERERARARARARAPGGEWGGRGERELLKEFMEFSICAVIT
jgi:hypothetical protein